MISIAQSAFLGALGKAIGNSLWQVAALWLAYAAISNIGRLSANRKYQLATGASLAGFVLFIGTFIYTYITAPLPAAYSSIYAESAAETGNAATNYWLFIYHSTAVSLQSLAPYISCAYLLMFILLCVRLGNGFRQVKFFATEGLEKADLHLRLFVQQHAFALGINRQVKIFASHHVQSPLTLGFWKPIILMPVASLSHLTIAQAESILLHELAHIRRYDYLVNILLQITEISLFFNPFMRLLLQQVKQERENSCDDYVLQFQYCPKDYAKALLAIEHSNNTALLALAAKGTQSFQLLNRVKRMVSPQPKSFNYRQQLGLLLLFTVLTLGVTVIIPHPKKANSKNKAAIAQKRTQYGNREITSLPEVPATEPAPPPPPLPVAYNVVESFLQNPKELVIFDEKKFEKNKRKIQLKEAEIEALGRKMELQLKPMEKKMEAWATGFSNQHENISVDRAMELANNNQWQELQQFNFDTIACFTEVYQKQITEKVNQLVKLIPINISAPKIVFRKEPRINITTNINTQRHAADEVYENEKNIAIGRADYARNQLRKSRINMEQLRQQIDRARTQATTNEWKQVQAQLRMLEDSMQLSHLHLGSLTDNRDTTWAKANSLLAKVQKRFIQRPFATSHVVMPPATPQPPKERCTITISENNIKITADDFEWQAPGTINVQPLDIHQERKINNGKEEKVVVISFNSSR